MQNKPLHQMLALFSMLWSFENTAYASATIEELSRLQSETILLQAKLKQAELRSELSARNYPKHSVEVEQLPVVQAVYGAGNERYATLLYNSGMTLDAKTGDLIPGGFTVISISVDQILLSKGKQRAVLGFATVAKPASNIPAPFLPNQTFGPSTSLPPLSTINKQI